MKHIYNYKAMPAHTIRVLAESKNTAFTATDANTSEPLFWWRGSDLKIETALSANGQFLSSADVGTINVAVKSLNATATDPVSMLKQITGANCDGSFTPADWSNGTGQLCVVEFTKEEAALLAGEYVLIISHDDPNGKRNTYLHARVLVKEDQFDSTSIEAPPIPAQEYYTKTEVDALVSVAPSDVINVLNYGVIGDGIADDSQAVQDALDLNGSAQSTVLFPAGLEILCRNLRINSNTIVLANGCKFKLGGTNPASFQYSPENSQSGIFHVYGTEEARVENVTIEGGELEGSRPSDDWTTFAEEDAIQAAWVDNLKISKMRIHDFRQDSIELKGCRYSTIKDCIIYDGVDSAIEMRGGCDNSMRNNHIFRCRNGFMCKPFVKSTGGTEDGERYTVKDNILECFGVSILNNWANNSTFKDNTFKPLDVTGESGLSSVCIQHQPHPVTARASDVMEGIQTTDNVLVGDITNTFIRQLGTGSTTYGVTTYEGNKVLDSCDKGLDLYKASAIENNHIRSVTASSDRTALILTPQTNSKIKGNNLPSGSTIILPGDSDSNVFVAENNISTLDARGNNLTIKGNISSRIDIDSACGKVTCSMNTITLTSGGNAPLDINANDGIYSHNKIVRTSVTSGYAVRINSDNNIISHNNVSSTAGTFSVIETLTGHNRNTISNNHVESTGATGSAIRIYGDNNRVLHNRTFAGNQGIRVYGNETDVIGNQCHDPTYQHIDIQSGAINTLVDHNSKYGTGSGYQDLGTGTIKGTIDRGL